MHIQGKKIKTIKRNIKARNVKDNINKKYIK